MATEGKGPSKLRLNLWRAGAGVLACLCVGLSILIWLGGEQETKDAFEAGRRLLIKFDNGLVIGRHINADEVAASLASHPAPGDTAVAAAPVPAKPAQTTVQGTEMVGPQLPVETPDAIVPPPPPEAPTAAVVDISALPATNPLPDANPELLEKTSSGAMLPIIGGDGTKPWRYYAKKFTRQGSQPMVAIIVSGLGQNKSVSETALKLHENFTLSFTPYARDFSSWANASRVTGHEMLIDLPMEPTNYPATDPGPHGLLIDRGATENESRLQWNMSRFSVFVGFLTPQNESFSTNDELFKLLLQSLANRGLMMVIGREPAKNDTKDIIEATNTATVVADTMIDEDPTPSAIQSRLATLEQLALKRGYAVGIAQPLPVTIEQLNMWVATLGAKGIVLVPVTAVARLRFS